MVHVRSVLDRELREWGLDLLNHLGEWLDQSRAQDLGLRYMRLGKQCFELEIPLHEAVRSLCLLREKMLDFAEEHMVSNSPVELYAEEELGRRLGRLFDSMIIHLVQGHERMTRVSQEKHVAAH